MNKSVALSTCLPPLQTSACCTAGIWLILRRAACSINLFRGTLAGASSVRLDALRLSQPCGFLRHLFSDLPSCHLKKQKKHAKTVSKAHWVLKGLLPDILGPQPNPSSSWCLGWWDTWLEASPNKTVEIPDAHRSIKPPFLDRSLAIDGPNWWLMIKVKEIDFIDRLPHEVLDTPCWVAALKLVPLEVVPAHVAPKKIRHLPKYIPWELKPASLAPERPSNRNKEISHRNH